MLHPRCWSGSRGYVTERLLLLALCTLGPWSKTSSLSRTPEVQSASSETYGEDLPLITRAANNSTLTAVTDSLTGKGEFTFEGKPQTPVLEARPGSILTLTYRNDLSKVPREPCLVQPCRNLTNLHFHGLHVSPDTPQDNSISMMAAPGQTLHYRVQVPLDQPPGLYWYHTHPHHETYQQDLDGMSGPIVITGIDRYLPELRGMEERILVLRDRVLGQHDPGRDATLKAVQAQPNTCGLASDSLQRAFTLNGVLRPTIGIAPKERQFWRLVNASPDLFADVEIPGSVLQVVALDGMPFAYHNPHIRTLPYEHVVLPPGGRLEAIVTGAEGAARLQTRCVDTGKDGDPNPAMVLADLVPRPQKAPRHTMLANYGAAVHQVPSPALLEAIETGAASFRLVFSEDKAGFYINGQRYSMTGPPMVIAKVGTYQHWTVENTSDEVHPFHIHQVHFLAYKHEGRPYAQAQWRDTINVSPHAQLELLMDFTDPVIRGDSLFHCHLLKHEDKGMMATVRFE